MSKKLWSLLVLFVMSCGANPTSTTNSSNSAEPLLLEGELIAISPSPSQSVNLGIVKDQELTIVASSKFSGDVDLTIEREELDLIDKKAEVLTTVVPSRVTLAAGETKKFNVRIETKSSSPSFTGEHFHVVAKHTESTAMATQEIPLELKAIFEIHFLGGAAPEKWSSLQSHTFRTHTDGVLVRYVNMDQNATHIVHGTGAIPHGPTNAPLAKATANAPGGVYEVRVTKTTPNLSGIYYCHSHEANAQARTLIFNVNK